MDPRETEDVVHRALKALPAPRAPRTLLPRVMAAVDDRRALLAGRPAPGTWFTWPVTWQAASVAALLVLAAGIVWVWPAAWEAAGTSAARAWTFLEPRMVSAAASAAAVVRVIAIVWQAFVQPVVGYVLVWIVVMSGACAACVAALGRVALGGASHP
jgi:hypothetical protein